MDRILEGVAAPLIDWYKLRRRPLPWRDAPTPYHVWVSEVMLQQTRIEAAIPYYERFLARLPDVKALADISEEELLKLWEGLGYYSRARNLKKAAERVVKEYGGALPNTAAALRKLPGVGEYTAGAIASIAFGEPEPAVDGNVLRVLLRFLSSDEDALSPGTKARITALLREIYPAGEAAGLLTQGLMELGEVVCLPNTTPLCGDCPLRDQCRGFREGTASSLPVRAPKKARRIEERTVLLLRCGERYAVRRRPPTGLLANLWELPGLPGTLTAAELMERFPGATVEPLGGAVHLFTHIEWRMTGWRLELPAPIDGYVWETAETIRREFAIPSAFRAFLRRL